MVERFIHAVHTRFLSQERGQSTVEFAAMLIVVVFLLLGLGSAADEIKEIYRGIAHMFTLL